METTSLQPPLMASPSTEDKTNNSVANDTTLTENNLQLPAVRPPRKISKPKISLKMPPIPAQVQIPAYYQTPGGITIPLTPVTGLSPNYPVNFFHAYPNKAQEFMFKQFEGFKGFTKNTGKLGLNFGEKFAFWMYGKVRELSKNVLTHIFLFLVICLYCALGGIILYITENKYHLESQNEDLRYEQRIVNNISTDILQIFAMRSPLTINVTKAEIAVEVNKLTKALRTYYGIHRQKSDLVNWMYFCGTVFTTIGLLMSYNYLISYQIIFLIHYCANDLLSYHT